MIGWIKYILLCDWSKENEIFDSCQVLSQHESEILNDPDQRLYFPSRLGASISASRRKFPNKNKIISKNHTSQGTHDHGLLMSHIPTLAHEGLPGVSRCKEHKHLLQGNKGYFLDHGAILLMQIFPSSIPLS